MSDDELSNMPKVEETGHVDAVQADVAATDNGRKRRSVNPKSPRQAIQPENAAPPPQRSRFAKHPLVVVANFFMMASVLGALLLGTGLYFGKLKYNAKGPLTETRSVMVSRGSNLDSIAAQLERRNVIDSKTIFWIAAYFHKVDDQLKAGEYLFEPGVSMKEVMSALVSGRSILHAVTIPEGLTSSQIVAKLLASEVLVGEIETVPAEGKLLPETYKFTRGMTRQKIIEQMRQAHEKAVQEIWQRRVDELPVKTPEELVTLASIVEKETGKADERPRVASVFINRLRQNMRLQSDPTIIYGIFGGEGKPSDRPIYRSDIDKPTPYNTYQINGLPPGPIANPGRAALEAVANPSRTNDLYFVADGSGGHVFAETLQDHNRNVARWRQVEKARQAAIEAAKKATEDTESTEAEKLRTGSIIAKAKHRYATDNTLVAAFRCQYSCGIESLPKVAQSMALFSMTGFSRQEFDSRQDRYAWEIKSVNARNLELRLRLPNGLDFLEPEIRRIARDRLARGSVFLNLSQERTGSRSVVQVNEDALSTIVAAALRLVETHPDIGPPDAAALLGIRGVLEDVDPGRDAEQLQEFRALALGALEQCLAALVQARADEGQRLSEALVGQIDGLENLVGQTDNLMEKAYEILRQRLSDQIAVLVSEKSFDPDRLHQEAVLLASKQDIREEIDRLKSHCTAARELLLAGGAVGRRLDFLAQEFNREANTICSKSFDSELTAIGLDMKATIEQFREQVQNLE